MNTIIQFENKRQAYTALARVAKKQKLVYTQQKCCAYDNKLTATVIDEIDYHNNQEGNEHNQIDEEKYGYYYLELSSNVLGEGTMSEIAEETKGRAGEIIV